MNVSAYTLPLAQTTNISHKLQQPLLAKLGMDKIYFSSSHGSTSKTATGGFQQHTTNLFRERDQLTLLPTILKQHFPKGCPIYDYACSDGSEPYSIAIALNELEFNPKQYPILARDISPAILKLPKQGYLPLMPLEAEAVKKLFLKAELTDYFEIIPEATPKNISNYYNLEQLNDGYSLEYYDEGERLYKISNTLKEWTHFEQGDLGQDTFKKAGVFFFNHQFYHDNNDEKLLENLYNHMPPGSILFGSPNPDKAFSLGFKPLYPDKFHIDNSGLQALIKPNTVINKILFALQSIKR